MSVEIRRGTAAITEREPGRLTRHGLSFGAAYDPENLRFGPMVCHDDHLLRAGHGFPAHRHADLVIVSYVGSGALRHTGPGGEVVVPAGSLALFRTGGADAGAEHAEVAVEPQTRFVQVWLADPDPPVAPSYEVLDPSDSSSPARSSSAARPARWSSLSRPDGIEVLPGARLSVLTLGDHETVVLPAASRLHAYVARGALLRSSLAQPLAEGDAFRFVDEPAHEVIAAVPTVLLVWAFDA